MPSIGGLGRSREVRVELLADLQSLLARKGAVVDQGGNGFEVVILSTGQTPINHPRRRNANVLEGR